MKTRVLVVDDDRLVADTLSLIFNANGYECEARYCAADAFERAQSFVPAMMLCDLSMPDEDGLHLAARMRASLPETRLLLLTAHSDPASETLRLLPRTKGLPKLLLKPCRPDDLLREAQALLA